MNKSTMVTAITAIAIAVVLPFALAQTASGPGMMGGDGTGWAHENGGMWALMLLCLGFVGLAAWVVRPEPGERIANEKVLQPHTISSTQAARLDSAGEGHSTR